MIIRKIKHIINRKVYRKRWRINNLHNETIPNDDYPDGLVTIGSYTYGTINVDYYGMPYEHLEIGSFCSIASGCTFITGGGHLMNRFTTFPIDRKINLIKEETSKGSIIIKDDVWIGKSATILSGVTIGQGAIIGANSVVAKDIPPYAIVVGNPAKIIRFRFNEVIVNELLKINFKLLILKSKNEISDYYQMEITEFNVKDLVKRING